MVKQQQQEQNRNPIDSRVSGEVSSNSSSKANKGNSFPGQKPHFQNPPDSSIPDAATLRDQWRFAIRQYSKWYSHAWGTAILAGMSFFALGWVIKGSNPLPSKQEDPKTDRPDKA